LQPTRQDTGTNKLAIPVLSLTQSTLLLDPFTKDLDTLTLNKSLTELIRKGHQRHDNTTACYVHHIEINNPHINGYKTPHTTIEILSESLLKDLVALQIIIDLFFGKSQKIDLTIPVKKSQQKWIWTNSSGPVYEASHQQF